MIWYCHDLSLYRLGLIFPASEVKFSVWYPRFCRKTGFQNCHWTFFFSVFSLHFWISIIHICPEFLDRSHLKRVSMVCGMACDEYEWYTDSWWFVASRSKCISWHSLTRMLIACITDPRGFFMLELAVVRSKYQFRVLGIGFWSPTRWTLVLHFEINDRQLEPSRSLVSQETAWSTLEDWMMVATKSDPPARLQIRALSIAKSFHSKMWRGGAIRNHSQSRRLCSLGQGTFFLLDGCWWRINYRLRRRWDERSQWTTLPEELLWWNPTSDHKHDIACACCMSTGVLADSYIFSRSAVQLLECWWHHW